MELAVSVAVVTELDSDDGDWWTATFAVQLVTPRGEIGLEEQGISLGAALTRARAASDLVELWIGDEPFSAGVRDSRDLPRWQSDRDVVRRPMERCQSAVHVVIGAESEFASDDADPVMRAAFLDWCFEVLRAGDPDLVPVAVDQIEQLIKHEDQAYEERLAQAARDPHLEQFRTELEAVAQRLRPL